MTENQNERPALVIVAGPNGSGKTTLTEQLLKHHWLSGCTYINPDNIAQELGDWNDPALSLQAAKIAQERRETLLQHRRSIAFETVYSAPDKLDFLQRAYLAGYFTRMFFIATECPSINAARITRRFLRGGHAVPIDRIVNRYYKSIQQGACSVEWLNRLDVFDNSQDGAVRWKHLFSFSPDRQLRTYVPEPDISAWARALHAEAAHFHVSTDGGVSAR